MARTFKQPPKQNLRNLPVLINDTTSYSEYFEVSELNRIFHAGRNGFLLRGTDLLRRGSNIAIEVVDRFGTPVFSTPINGYSEGGSRLISIEIFQETERGPGFLTIVGEATQYADGRPIPPEYRGRPNVKWSVPIQIEPNNQNRTRIRLANAPIAEVEEQNFDNIVVEEVTTDVSNYTASLFYDFEVEESDGYAIRMISASGQPEPFFDDDLLDGSFTGSLYRRVVSRLYNGGVEVPSSQSIIDSYRTASVDLNLDKVLNETTAITQDVIQFNGEDFPTTRLISGSFEYLVDSTDLGGGLVRKTLQEYTSSVVFRYVAETITTTAATSSIINFRIPFAQTNTGEISKVKISAKDANSEITAFQPFSEFVPGEKNILVTTSSIGNVDIGYFLSSSILENNWHAANFAPGGNFNRTDYEATESINSPLEIFTSSVRILEGAKVDNTESSNAFFFGTKEPLELFEEIEYTLRYTAVYTPSYTSGSTTYTTTGLGDLDVYLARTGADSSSRAESAVRSTIDDPYGLLVDEVTTKTNDKSLYEREVNFRVLKSGLAHLRFVSNEGFWSFGNIEIFPAVEKGFNPDEIVWDAENNLLVNSTNIFKIQFLNWNDEPIDYEIITSPIFISGAADPGLDGFTVEITNPNFTFRADSDNSVISYEGGGTDISILNGATPLGGTLFSPPPEGSFSASIQSATNITPNEPFSILGDTIRYGDPSGMPDSADSASITYEITATWNASTYTFTKKQSFTKVQSGTSGSDGVSPVSFTLTPTTQTIAAGSDGSVTGSYQDIIISGSEGQTPLVYNQSPTLGLGEYKIVDVSGSITVIDTTPATQVVQVTAASQDTNQCSIEVEYTSSVGISGSTNLFFTIVKSKEGDNGNPGTDGSDGANGDTPIIYYIQPNEGRSFKTSADGVTTTPSQLTFTTKQASGSVISNQVSGSVFGLFYSSSGNAVAGSAGSATYTVTPADILGNDVLEFKSASVLVDSIDVADVTDGLAGLVPVLTVDGPITYISASSGIVTTGPTHITGSLYRDGTETEWLRTTLSTPSGTPPEFVVPSTVVSSSTNVSSSFTLIENADSVAVSATFKFFSQSLQVAQETFNIVTGGKDGSPGGANGVSIFVDPTSQVVSQSTTGTIDDPQDVFVQVIEDGNLYSFDDTSPFGNSSFRYQNLTGGVSSSGGVLTPDTPVDTSGTTMQWEIVYVDSGGGSSGAIPVTHSVNVVLDGSTGPGIVFTGVWDTTRDYQYDITNGRRDAVLWSTDGNEPYDSYYVTLQEANSTIDSPDITTGSYWQYLGPEDFFVAAKIAIFEESFVKNVLNIGSNNNGSLSSANITLQGSGSFPYLSIGQSNDTGSQGYAVGSGIFIGRDSADGFYKASFETGSTNNGLYWTGTDLVVSGSLYATSGSFSGSVSVGNRVIIGPDALPEAPTPTTVLSPATTNVSVVEYSSTPPAFESNTYTGLAGTHDISTPDLGDQIEYTIDFIDVPTEYTGSGGSTVGELSFLTVTLYVYQGTSTFQQSYPLLSLYGGGSIPTKKVYYTSVGTDTIRARFAYTGSVTLYGNPSPEPQRLFFTSITGSSSDPNLTIQGTGIYVNRGQGVESLLDLALNSDGQTGGGGGGTGDGIFAETGSYYSTTNDLQVTGSFDITGTGTGTDWVATSDLRLKNVIGNISYGLDDVMKMSPIVYTWKDSERGIGRRIGFGAQDLEKIVPEVVYGDENTQYGVSYQSLVPVLVNAIKELKLEIDMLRQLLRLKD